MENDKIKKLYALILKDGDKTPYPTLAKRLGFTKEEIETYVTKRIYEVAKYGQLKLLEVEEKLLPREDVLKTLSKIHSMVSNKLMTYMQTEEFQLDKSFKTQMDMYVSTLEKYAALEGLNKPVKFEHTLKNNYDFTKFTTKETEIFFKLHTKALITFEA